MPVYEEPRSGGKWWKILLAGCAGITVIIVCVIVLVTIYISRSVSGMMSSSAPPPKSSASLYKVPSDPKPAKCSFMLPSGFNKITYYHTLPNPVYWGERGIRITYSAGMSHDWPLPYSHLRNVKIGVYWYEAKNGLGPFIRFYDASGNSVLDLGNNEIGDICKFRGSYVFARYAYSLGEFSGGCGITTDSSGKVLSVTDPYGNPARNVSAAINPANCTYLGSIVLKGNKLVFVSNPTGKNQKP